MSKTLANVRSQIRSYLDETTQSDWTDPEINKVINTYYHAVRTAVITTFEDYYITATTFDTTADKQEYTSTDGVPTDIFKIRRVEVNFDVSNSNSNPVRMQPIFNMDAVRRDLGQANSVNSIRSGYGGNYYTYGFESTLTIGFIPIPDKDGTDAVKIWYVPVASDLSADASTLSLPYVDKNWLLVCYGAVAELLRFGAQESEEADKFERKFALGLDKMQEELEDREASNSKSILDVQGLESFEAV